MTLKQAWEDSISPQLLPRLLRPVLQPGVIDTQIARKIIQRSQNLANRLPLLTQVQKNWCKVSNLDVGQVPIVYAHQRRNANNEIFNTSNPKKSSRQANEKPRMVIQAKFAPGKNSQKMPLSNSDFNSKQAVSLNSNALNTPVNRVVGINATEVTDGTSSTKGNLLNKETIKPGLSLEHKHNKEKNQEENQEKKQEKNQEQFRKLNFGSVAVTRETSSIDSNSTLPVRDIINHAPAGQLPLVQAKFAPSKNFSTEQASTTKLDSINHNSVSNSIALKPGLSKNKPQTSQIAMGAISGAEVVYNQAQTSPLREINSRLIDIPEQQTPLVYHSSEPLISDTVNDFVTGNSQLPIVKPRPTTPSQKISSNGKLETMPINLGNKNDKMPFYQPSLAAKDLATTKAEAERASQNMVNQNNQVINHNSISQQKPITIIESPQISNNTEKNNMDLDALVDKLESKLMRKFIAENERRGQGQWR
ncbi:MAG: hypothetical protein KME64_17290 [Scytonematopsis contorta HA4267-MV1]|jgi:hypothetical protein|nr:hypothetical protein [Scytonematopsis contorta HA4267-MV1]